MSTTSCLIDEMAAAESPCVSLIHYGDEPDTKWMPGHLAFDRRRDMLYLSSDTRLLRLQRPAGPGAKYQHTTLLIGDRMFHIAVDDSAGYVLVVASRGIMILDPFGRGTCKPLGTPANIRAVASRKVTDGPPQGEFVLFDDRAGVHAIRCCADREWRTLPLTIEMCMSDGVPQGACCDGRGNIFVCRNNIIQRIDRDGCVTIVAGSPGVGSPGVAGSHKDGTGAAARFDLPTVICMDDETDTLYVADQRHIRRVVPCNAPSVAKLTGAFAHWPPGLVLLVAAYLPADCGEVSTVAEWTATQVTPVWSMVFVRSAQWAVPSSSDTSDAATAALRLSGTCRPTHRDASGDRPTPTALLLAAPQLHCVLRIPLPPRPLAPQCWF